MVTTRPWFLASAHGRQVGMYLTTDLARALDRRGQPWLRLHPALTRPDTPQVISGIPGPDDGPTRTYTEQEGNGALRKLHHDPGRRIVWIPDRDPAHWHELQLLRAVRNLLRWQALRDGLPCLHGGLIDLDGAGILVVGRKRSGKTSTVLTSLGLLSGRFVSNDDVTLIPDGRDWIGIGWPRSVNVRADAAQALTAAIPLLGRLRAASTHPRMEYTTATSPSFTVYPQDICRVLDVPAAASVPVIAIVLPTFTDTLRPTLTRLDPATARARLLDNVDRVATDHDGYLIDWFDPLDEHTATRHADQLAQQLPCYQLTQHLDGAAATARLLADLATGRRRELV